MDYSLLLGIHDTNREDAREEPEVKPTFLGRAEGNTYIPTRGPWVCRGETPSFLLTLQGRQEGYNLLPAIMFVC